MVGFLKKLERTDVPFLQAAEILYGQGGEVHVLSLIHIYLDADKELWNDLYKENNFQAAFSVNYKF